MERVDFSLGFSKFYAVLFVVLYLGTVAILIWLPMMFLLKILSISIFIYDFQRMWTLHVKRNAKDSIVRLWQDSKGYWGFQTHSGQRAIGRLKGDSYKSRWLLVLRVRLSRRSFSVMIPRDAMNTFQYRTLCARLKCSEYLP